MTINPYSLVRVISIHPGVGRPNRCRVLMVADGIATVVEVDAAGEPVRGVAVSYPVEVLRVVE